jgi:hypothetical protein
VRAGGQLAGLIELRGGFVLPRKEYSEVLLAIIVMGVPLRISIPTMIDNLAPSLGDRCEVSHGATAEGFEVVAEAEGYFLLAADFSNRPPTSLNE